MESDLIATITISRRREGGQVTVRVQHADGKWHESTVDRYTSIGWHEMKLLWEHVRNDLEGVEPYLPF